MSKALLRWIGVGVIAFVFVALVANTCQSERRLAKARAAENVADSLRIEAQVKETAVRAELDSIKRSAVVTYKRDTVLLTRTITVQAEPVPEGCEEVVKDRDELIADWQVQAADWRVKFEAQIAATGRALDVVDLLKASNDTLKKAVELYKPRPTNLAYRLLHPEVKPAVFAGVCADGRPCAGLGVALTF